MKNTRKNTAGASHASADLKYHAKNSRTCLNASPELEKARDFVTHLSVV